MTVDGTLRAAAGRRGVLVGTAVVPELIANEAPYRETLAREFDCMVAENIMKPMYLQPERGRFDFALADTLVDFSRANRMRLRGHTLVWHHQMPAWLKDTLLPKEEALRVMGEHIEGVAGHFRGSVFAWDVVNEALADSGGWREDSPWYRMTGPDYLDFAFHRAHAADPGARLFYNDYGMEGPNPKADACYILLKGMLERGVPVHGVGFQCHLGLENRLEPGPCIANIKRFHDLGLEVHFTEMDMGIRKPVTDELRREQGAEYANRVRIALAAGVSALVFWGFTDRYSWIPGFTKGEMDEALPFDREYRAKPAVEAMIQALQEEV